mgnify:FL=1|jgi:CDP-paratose 2-epimerase|tara:strand:- start:69 stop:1121 length:1053 start_codon:yes stop_codon:yes gene_type:complete
MKKIVVSGSNGLIGGEVVSYFSRKGMEIYGLDNNMRADFFGPAGDTIWNQNRLQKMYNNYSPNNIDVRDRDTVIGFIEQLRPDAVIHTAAQPSHDLAASRPFDDFDVNCVGTMNLLEATRRCSTSIPFVHMSTNKVYGDAPNKLALVEKDKRWDYADERYYNGINEMFTIDHSTHSIFGASKVGADIMVQEYGKYFGMPTCSLRGGCLTGPTHGGVELHGFLSYLIKCNLIGKKYIMYGYKGKQVRDNIHSYDVANFIHEYLKNPKPGEVYNLGGGRNNSISILEAFEMIENISGKIMQFEYSDENRIGDHICYISDLTKMKSHYSNWKITKALPEIFQEIYQGWTNRLE